MPFVAADSFTTIARVEARVGRGAFEASGSVPNIQQVLDWMALRSSEIGSVMVAAGLSYTVPNGGGAIPTNTADGIRLANLADNANALFAAGDAIAARDTREGAPPDQAVALWAEARLVLGDIAVLGGAIAVALGTGYGRSSTTTGGIEKADFNEIGQGAERPRSSLVNLDTKW